jgi:hypothetical protein
MLGVVILMLILTGCSALFQNLLLNEKKEADAMAQKIVDALENKDENALRNLFSAKALTEIEDFDKGSEYVMGLYQGGIISLGDDYPRVSDHFGPPGRTKMLESAYWVTTDQGSYLLYFEYWIIQEQDPSAEGLYKIKLDTQETREAESFMGGGGYDRPGIYQPDWDEDMAKQPDKDTTTIDIMGTVHLCLVDTEGTEVFVL